MSVCIDYSCSIFPAIFQCEMRKYIYKYECISNLAQDEGRKQKKTKQKTTNKNDTAKETENNQSLLYAILFIIKQNLGLKR